MANGAILDSTGKMVLNSAGKGQLAAGATSSCCGCAASCTCNNSSGGITQTVTNWAITISGISICPIAAAAGITSGMVNQSFLVPCAVLLASGPGYVFYSGPPYEPTFGNPFILEITLSAGGPLQVQVGLGGYAPGGQFYFENPTAQLFCGTQTLANTLTTCSSSAGKAGTGGTVVATQV